MGSLLNLDWLGGIITEKKILYLTKLMERRRARSNAEKHLIIRVPFLKCTVKKTKWADISARPLIPAH
jgi:hypothetical protein